MQKLKKIRKKCKEKCTKQLSKYIFKWKKYLQIDGYRHKGLNTHLILVGSLEKVLPRREGVLGKAPAYSSYMCATSENQELNIGEETLLWSQYICDPLLIRMWFIGTKI